MTDLGHASQRESEYGIEITPLRTAQRSTARLHRIRLLKDPTRVLWNLEARIFGFYARNTEDVNQAILMIEQELSKLPLPPEKPDAPVGYDHLAAISVAGLLLATGHVRNLAPVLSAHDQAKLESIPGQIFTR